MEIRPPVRVTRSYRQRLAGTPAQVLPLLCPVREVDWAPGWQPGVVLTYSGLVEEDCVFTTPEPAAGSGVEAIWTVLEHDPEAGIVEMVKVTPGFTVTRLRVELAPSPAGGSTADVTYSYTALGPAGEEFVAGRTVEAYAQFMRGWEAALNRYLRGSPLPPRAQLDLTGGTTCGVSGGLRRSSS